MLISLLVKEHVCASHYHQHFRTAIIIQKARETEDYFKCVIQVRAPLRASHHLIP